MFFFRKFYCFKYKVVFAKAIFYVNHLKTPELKSFNV